MSDISGQNYRGIDLFAAVLPCPPFSVAGKQLGEKDERNLFPQALRLIKDMDPKFALIENVRGFLGPAFEEYRGPDLGPTRAKKAWLEFGVNGMTIAKGAPEKGFKGVPRLTVNMVARIQGFPDTWKFTGRKTNAYRQVGNAFPPPVAKALGKAIKKAILASEKQMPVTTQLAAEQGMNKRKGARTRLRENFLANIGKKLTGTELREVARNISESARRVRELRTEEGYQEYPKLCVWGLAHAVETGHLLNRSGYRIAN